MNILAWVLFGLITGIIANMLDPNPKEANILTAMLFGVTGAVVGGLLANFMLGLSITGFNLTSFLIAVIGSLVVLVVSSTVRKT